MTSLGSVGKTPSPGTTVSARTDFGKAAAASPRPTIVRRSIPWLIFWLPFVGNENHTLFLFQARRMFASMRRLLALILFLIALPARADDGPAYGPMLEGYDYP